MKIPVAQRFGPAHDGVMATTFRSTATPAMPSIPNATPTTVYATNERNTVCQRCIRCAAWAPIWNPDGDSKIRIGMMIRAHNPRLGMKMANGEIDTRELIMFPKTRVGHGCPVCMEEYNALVLKYRSAREPFVPVKSL